jgi:hypothetical protein
VPFQEAAPMPVSPAFGQVDYLAGLGVELVSAAELLAQTAG